jgi:hypothetical protein
VASSTEVTREPEPEPVKMESRSQLDRRISAEHHAVETTVFPIEADTDFQQQGSVAIERIDLNESRPADQSLDAGAFSAESLSSASSADVLSHWNDPNSKSTTAVLGEKGPLAENPAGEDLLDASALESHENGFRFGSSDSRVDLFDPLDDETDTDLTPLIDVGSDVTDELTSPLVPDEAVTSTMPTLVSAPIDSTGAVFDQPMMFFDSSAAPTASSSESAIDSTPDIPLRPLKALEAIPISMGTDWIEIDASPKGKSKLPFHRIQTLAMAAVDGLGEKPVLVVDCLLSGSGAIGGSGQSGQSEDFMKSIRFRGDRFDPLQFVPDAANALAALTAWIRRLQAGSNANCLPSREILGGSFERFASIEAYEREVLGALQKK